ncbi:acetyl/propionyl-CoA carboxylase alpha subunit [Geodermatophilus bullaregiensis]|uniref:acetyl-CoA carboxylase family protein n=1 Tax=Geodermatophilus bullaregiensis TaxID=1564160 RepID=UPI00195EF83D|nr:carboxyl transferase domain-containing protein [Geodermatophilus bullaregiensis]MBM7805127.1 acetyl/propionyl-CoA carboxylase alpha subunit [Geodermatophilus bullaregiensis]
MTLTRLLVANRGDVAVRVLRTAAALGLPTVAVAPEDDAGALHVRRADASVRLPGAGPAAYLDVAALVGAAVRAGADGLHPGWGFLAESPELARACADAGVTFVGPDAGALALFGDKTRTRARAAELGIPVLAATPGDTGLAEATRFLAGLGEGGAVMVKARAGGGGRGVRPVRDPAELAGALERCRSEARSAFGDAAVYVERLLTGARHVEVQVAGDGTDVVALGDRDCSLQRRRQKLVEVAPAPGLDDGVRTRLAGAAVALCGSAGYRGLATVEFLVRGDEAVLLEVNPRLQVEHTVTEEVTGLDLVEVGLRLAEGATLAGLGLTAPPPARGVAVQARVNAETLLPDGTVQPAAGVLERFVPPTGRGVRVDTAAVPGGEVSPRYDSLLAKVVVADRDLPRALAGAARALAELDVAGVATNRDLLTALVALPEMAAGRATTDLVDGRLAEFVPDRPAEAPAAVDGVLPVIAPLSGAVVEVAAAEGDAVAAGATLVVLEAMKMEHVVAAPAGGVLTGPAVRVGDVVTAGTVLGGVVPSDDAAADAGGPDDADLDAVRPELAELRARRAATLDDARPEVVARRQAAGRMTAREVVAALVDEGTFVEYGQLGIAAQRARRSVEELVERTPADGMVTGVGEVDGVACAVLVYDYTVLAGTQGRTNHRKTDRLLEVAAQRRLPVVLVAEGGGGRPGDTDGGGFSRLDVPTFTTMARLAGRVPTVAVVSGYCFAGNAALVGCCDVVVATEDSSIGMGGPAMIEAGGLGVVAPGDVGPTAVQAANGVVDVVVPDDAAAVAAARQALGLLAGRVQPGAGADQRLLRTALPANRVRSYDVRPVVTTLADGGSVLELRPSFGRGVVTALARLDGRPVGFVANDPRHLGGAIDGESADKAAAFLRLCSSAGLPVVSLVDTPGFMVGPESERTGTVRRFGGLYVAGAQLDVPLLAVVLRKAYGLGAMAMLGGDLRAPLLTLAWPTGEFGPMSLEGAIRLGHRRELAALPDDAARQARFAELVAESYAQGTALNVASAFEVDDVVDPADTRDVLVRALAGLAGGAGRA